jgi:hypothetical protein
MLRFSLIATVQPGRALEIKNGFVRMLALRSARLGAEIPLPPMLEEEQQRGTSVRERYAPMHRLLTQDDDLFLVGQGFPDAAKKLRREHRHCYFRYLACLTQEIRDARKLSTLAMSSTRHWSFPALLEQMAIAESSLLYLRWLGCRHAAGVTVAASDVRECLDFLLAGQKFRLATT